MNKEFTKGLMKFFWLELGINRITFKPSTSC